MNEMSLHTQFFFMPGNPSFFSPFLYINLFMSDLKCFYIKSRINITGIPIKLLHKNLQEQGGFHIDSTILLTRHLKKYTCLVGILPFYVFFLLLKQQLHNFNLRPAVIKLFCFATTLKNSPKTQ